MSEECQYSTGEKTATALWFLNHIAEFSGSFFVCFVFSKQAVNLRQNHPINHLKGRLTLSVSRRMFCAE